MKRLASIRSASARLHFPRVRPQRIRPFHPAVKMPNPALEFFIGMAATGYMLPLLYIDAGGRRALLLVGLFVPLALAMLAPIIVNILLFHLFLAPVGIPVALILVAFEVFARMGIPRRIRADATART